MYKYILLLLIFYKKISIICICATTIYQKHMFTVAHLICADVYICYNNNLCLTNDVINPKHMYTGAHPICADVYICYNNHLCLQNIIHYMPEYVTVTDQKHMYTDAQFICADVYICYKNYLCLQILDHSHFFSMFLLLKSMICLLQYLRHSSKYVPRFIYLSMLLLLNFYILWTHYAMLYKTFKTIFL